MSKIPSTISGLDAYECMSALQKHIRRGEEDRACWFAFELAASLPALVISRLRIIGQEDVGLGDPIAVVFAEVALDNAERNLKSKHGAWKLGIANAVLALSRATKSRLADEFQAVVSKMPQPPVPDYALDKHTTRGKALGRGAQHWVAEGCVLDSPSRSLTLLRDRSYAEEARKIWESGDDFELRAAE